MMRRSDRVFPLAATLIALAFVPRGAWACAACYGQSNSAMAEGMNWGIATLLGIIVVVLGGVACFFIVLARRAAAHPVRAVEPASALLLADDDSFAHIPPAVTDRAQSRLTEPKPFHRRCPATTADTVAGGRVAGGRGP